MQRNTITKPTSWHGTAISVRGAKHVADGRPCQDASKCIVTKVGYTVLLVADGAGSAKHSQIGSRTAVESASKVLLQGLASGAVTTPGEWRDLLESGMNGARNAVEKSCNADRPLKSVATTLLAMVIAPEFAITLSVGDCAGIVADDSGNWHLLSAPESGEYINQTFFLTESDWKSHARFDYWEGSVASAVAISDGLELIAMNRGLPFEPFLGAMVDKLAVLPARSRRAALRAYFSTYISGIRTDDDISFLAAWRS